MSSRLTVKALQVEMNEAIAAKDAIIAEMREAMEAMNTRLTAMEQRASGHRDLAAERGATSQPRSLRTPEMEAARKAAMESGKTVKVS